jgi:hypothetical protein
LPRRVRAGIFSAQVETMMHRKLTAACLTFLVTVPAIAGGRPACCVKKPVPAPHGCCASTTASTPKGCCKAPEAPRPQTRAQAGDAPALLSVASAALPASEVTALPTEAETVRVARLEHRAASPTDSPPDLLTRNRSLLI